MRHLLYCLLALYSAGVFSQVFNITNFGAVGDSVTLNTAAIQKAIDSCNKSGGGRVFVPNGIFLSGTIVMKSNVELYIDSSGVLKGSANLNDYPTISPQLRTYADQYVQRSLIFAEGVNNISFTGKGRVNGNGLAATFINSSNRVFGFRIYSCSNVKYEGLTLQNSAFWMMHNCNIDTLTIRNITITNHCYGNQDGVNIDMCRNVLVENCDIDGNNDPIVMKGMAPLFTRNVEVRNCTLATYSRAIKIGTETQGFFENVYVHDCLVKKSVRGPLGVDAKCGINLSIVDGGGLSNVRIENIQLEAITPIMIRLGNQARKHTASAPTPGVGYLQNVVLKNISAVATSNITSHITGIPNFKTQNITLENVSISVPGGMDSLPKFVVPEKENQKPEHDIFGDTLPAHGLFIRHVQNINLCNVKVSTRLPDNRPLYILDDVSNFDTACLSNITVVPSEKLFIYPNPATNLLMLSSEVPGNELIEITNVLGNKVLSTFSSNINISELPRGFYFLQFRKRSYCFVKE